MRVTQTTLKEVLLIEREVFGDDRGAFGELWEARRYAAAGIPGPFVQDNISISRCGVLRGLHYQWPTGQGKLVTVIRGEVFDVAVDIRRGSPTFGRWVGEFLSAQNQRQLWIPQGFAHGFLVTGEEAVFHYKVTAPYVRDEEVSIRWDDPVIGIQWPPAHPVLSQRDARAVGLKELPPSLAPIYTAGP